MTKNKERQMEFFDLYIAAYLALHGTPPRLILKNGKVLFVFEATDEVYHLMTMFNSYHEEPCPQFGHRRQNT